MAKVNELNAQYLRSQLFAALERFNHDNDGENPLSDEEIKLEMEKAKVVGSIADSLIELAKVEILHHSLRLKQERYGDGNRQITGGSAFFEE